MNDTVSREIPGASCDDGAVGQKVCMGGCKGIRETGPAPACRNACTADGRNEALEILAGLRLSYKRVGKMMEAKAIYAGMQAIKRSVQ